MNSTLIQFFQIYRVLPTYIKRALKLHLISILLSASADVLVISLLYPLLSTLFKTNTSAHSLGSPSSSYAESHYLTFLLILFSLSILFRVFITWRQSYLSAVITAHFSSLLNSSLLASTIADYELKGTSSFLDLYTTKLTNLYYSVFFFLSIIYNLALLLSLLLYLISLDTGLTLASILSLSFFYLIFVAILKPYLSRLSSTISNYQYNLQLFISASLSSIRNLLLNSERSDYLSRITYYDLSLRTKKAINDVLAVLPRNVLELSFIFLALILALFLRRENLLISYLPIFSVLLLCIQRMLPALQQVYGSYLNIKSYFQSVQSVLNSLTTSEPYSSSDYVESFTSFDLESIKLSHCNYTYPGSMQPTFKSPISLTISKGDRICLVGQSGSGKSTLLDLIIALRIPTIGSIAVNNRILETSSTPRINYVKSFTQSVQYIGQKVSLPACSIIEYVTSHSSSVDQQKLHTVFEVCQLFSFIPSVIDSCHMMIAESATNLSAGQAQRLALAHSLYQDPELLILDEATSSLDPTTELAFFSALTKYYPNLTVIAVTHRLSSLQCFTRYLTNSNHGLQESSYTEFTMNHV